MPSVAMRDVLIIGAGHNDLVCAYSLRLPSSLQHYRPPKQDGLSCGRTDRRVRPDRFRCGGAGADLGAARRHASQQLKTYLRCRVSPRSGRANYVVGTGADVDFGFPGFQ
jgi:predicted NAD/FAD-dependent oxidoreductase